MRIPSKWIVAAGALAAVLAGMNSSHAQQTIRVGWTIPAEESKYWMMRRPTEFPNLGKAYNVEWTQFQGTAPMTQALAAGALDCATQAPLSLANGVVGGNLKAYIVAQHVFEKPGGFSVYWAVMDNSPIKTIADLKGKTIGISVIGGGTHGPFNMLLQQNGVDPSNGHQAGRGRFCGFRGRLAPGPRRCRQHEPAVRGACRGQGWYPQAVFAESGNAEHRSYSGSLPCRLRRQESGAGRRPMCAISPPA